jgi:hypothetical protein
MPTVVYRNDRLPAQRIADRLEPEPSNGATSCVGTVVTTPTRCITRVYLGGLQARQPMIDERPQDPFKQGPTGGYGASASGNPADDIYGGG